MDQICMFDGWRDAQLVTSSVPQVNTEGFIPAELLIPEKWEAWKYRDSHLSLRGKPYEIEAVIALLPGNRLYVKEWMLYPFMYEYKTPVMAHKKYLEYRGKISEYMKRNDDHQRTWQTDELPVLSDMWPYADGEYSCFEYANKVLYGYRKTGTED